MPTQARLSFWITPDHEPSFREALRPRLAPLLARHGLTTSSNCPRPSLPGILSQLYALSDPTAVRAAVRALAQDPDWQAEMLALGSQFSPPSAAVGPAPGPAAASPAPAQSPPPSPRPLLRWTLGLFSTPATPSRIVPAGPGTRRGLWHSFGLADGMLSPVINQLLQDRRGFLWLTTGDGLSRFDGGEFRHFTTADGLPHDSLNALIETPDQALWIASNGLFAFARAGLCRYDGHTFSHYTEADGLPSDAVFSCWVTSAGVLWVSTARGLCYLAGERFCPVGSVQGPAPRAVLHAIPGRQGGHWLATEYGGCFFDGELFQPIPPEQSGLPGVIWSCFEDRHGRLWLGGKEGLRCREEEVWSSFDVAAAIPGGRGAAALGEDREGGVWFVAYPQGVFRLHQGRTTAWSVAEGLPSGRVLFGRFDREQQLWVATDGGGIARYHGAACRHFTGQDGLPGDHLTLLELDRRGRVWVGGDRGLVCRAGQEWQSIVATESWGTAPAALLEDHHGTLWAVTHSGVVQHRLKGEWTTLLPPSPQAWNCGSLAQAKDLAVWAANGAPAVYRFAEGECVTFTPADGVPPGQIRRLHADLSANRVFLGTTLGMVGCWEQGAFRLLTDGGPWGGHCVLDLFVDRQERLWIGTEGGGVACLAGQDLRVYTTADGLAANRVMRIAQVRAGHLLFATQGGGVSLWDGEIFQTLTAQDGLSCDAVRDLLEDRQGAYWFATEYGLTQYRAGSQPPTLRLTEVLADRQYDLTRPIAIPVSHPFVRFGFAAASLTHRGAAMVYRYRLEGKDADWQVTRDAQVTYHSLALGLYTLHVQAIDPDLLRSDSITVPVEIVADPRAEAVAEAFRQTSPQEEMVGNSPAMQALQDQVQQAAQTDLTVLLTGETGTGKAVVARLVHDRGLGPAAPFITVNHPG